MFMTGNDRTGHAPEWATPTSSHEEHAVTGAHPSRAVKRCGTEQPEVIGRNLTAGPLSVELDKGNLRYLRVGDVEVLRSVAFLVRDENWGTYVPVLSDLVVEQRPDGFSVRYHATCTGAGQEIGCDATIEGRGDGSLLFSGTASSSTGFVTARTGFVVLHPLRGVAGQSVEVEHVDGTSQTSTFPALVDPVQPFLNIRSLTHEVIPGVKATVRMDGDSFEMEDHRNWTDASFKTYVRPLALPWPYRLEAGETVRQSVSLTFSGAVPEPAHAADPEPVTIAVGQPLSGHMPMVGLGMPAEEIATTTASLERLERLAPRLLICAFDPRQRHGRRELEGYRVLCERTGAQCELEVVVESLDRFADELKHVALLVREAGLPLEALAVCPVGDLKSVLPGGIRPPAPPLASLYAAARAAFPGVRLGGGMFSFFTELNRKRPPAELLDFVHNATCPIVHAADDRSVMETHEALAYQVATARSFIGKTAYRIGPSSIGCRDNPHGRTWTPNPHDERICLVKSDPRQRGLFGAAWTLGYIASLAPAGVQAVCLGAPSGPLGLMHRPGDTSVPYYDALPGASVYPAYHVVAGLTRAAGASLVATSESRPSSVCRLAYRTHGATLLWLANLSTRDQPVRVTHSGARAYGIVLDEASFEQATAEPEAFQASPGPLDLDALSLGAYAVALVCIEDR
jgi:D-apionolactonase